MEKPLIVGEVNPYGGNPRYAMYPLPKWSAGGRLCRVIMGLTPKEYLRRFDRVNLCTGKWNRTDALAKAHQILNSREDGVLILLGNRVAAQFGVKYRQWVFSTVRYGCSGHRMVILPHPSGKNRAWNDPLALRQAQAALREAGVL